MACHGARRLHPMVDNLGRILGIELLAAAQGVELRAPLKTAPVLTRVIETVRAEVPPLGDDRFMAGDLETGARLVRDGRVSAAAGHDLLPAMAADGENTP